MSQIKWHLFIHPRTGYDTCVRFIDPDERYRWNIYQRANRKIITCHWCRRYAGLRVPTEKKSTNGK